MKMCWINKEKTVSILWRQTQRDTESHWKISRGKNGKRAERKKKVSPWAAQVKGRQLNRRTVPRTAQIGAARSPRPVDMIYSK